MAPDNPKKNEVITIHRLSKAASQTNFLKGSGLFKKVSFYPGKPQIVILTTSKVVIFNLEELSTVKKLSSGDNTYSAMSVHSSEPYIMVGAENSKVKNWYNLGTLFWPWSKQQALQIDDFPLKISDYYWLSQLVSSIGYC